MKKLRTGILGATGSAGMEFVNALYDHPWFEVGNLYASEKNAGKPFFAATTFDTSHLPEEIRSREVGNIDEIGSDHDILCSSLPSDIARNVEGECARHTPVISTTSAYRYESDVPIIITEINSEHYRLIEAQRRRGWNGWVAPGPNCTTVGLVMSLHP
ncbi:MAG: aspartate-semialdehyde dehydrogenase, partial [Candidatus Aenigmarchaeota archaeon]|nr:aspartate-semialdehyde dehydrogenase [Candidatus Aenigmarchaeota archaeon]